MKRNVFVIAMDGFNLETMQRLREAGRYEFHPLLPREKVFRADSYDYDGLLREADGQLAAFDGSVDAIVTWWDFPATGLVPVLSELWDLPGPSLRSVVALEHKYWSRLAQRAVAGEHVPPFAPFDPFEDVDRALALLSSQGIEYPFWVKPVKSVASYLGFRVDAREDFVRAMETIRAEIAQFADPFDRAMQRVDVPPSVRAAGAHACIAEGIISGRQCTVEGYVVDGEVHCYGVVDSIRLPGVSTFRGYQYPSQLPLPISTRMMQIAAEVVQQVELDHCCFNAEFFYDHEAGQIWILEFNTRLSQSHCDLFEKVDGASSQRAMLDVAQGIRPRMPRELGPYGAAGKLFLRATHDGVVRSVPSAEQIAAVQERYPGTRVELAVKPGQRLSELSVQESYSYELGRVHVGADDHEALDRAWDDVEELLTFDIEH
jgi:biotin carboxylase